MAQLELILFQAIMDNDIEKIKECLSQNVDLNIENPDGKTPLMIVSEQDSNEIAKLLIEHSARVDYQNKDGWTALMFACENNSEYSVGILAENADVNLKNKKGQRAVDIAEEHNYGHIAQTLFENDADMTGTAWQAESNNDYANQCWDNIKELLKKEGDIDEIKDHFDFMENVWHGVDQNWDYECKEELLKLAFKNNYVEAFEYLVDNTRRVGERFFENIDSDEFVQAEGDMRLFLLKNGFKPERYAIDEALTDIIEYGNIDDLEEYSKHGFCDDVFSLQKIFEVCNCRWDEDKMEMIDFFLKHTKDVNALGGNGQSVLSQLISCELVDIDMIKLLVDKDVDVSIVDLNDCTALDLAKDKRHVDKDVVKYLEGKMFERTTNKITSSIEWEEVFAI